MKSAIALLCLVFLGLTLGEELNKYVKTAREVKHLLQEGSQNCFLIMFVWKGEKEVEEKEALDATEIYKDYPECYTANLDVARSDAKNLLEKLIFENERDSFGNGREITKDDTPLLLAMVNGKGWMASGPKPHKAMLKELDALYRDHIKSDIEYEG